MLRRKTRRNADRKWQSTGRGGRGDSRCRGRQRKLLQGFWIKYWLNPTPRVIMTPLPRVSKNHWSVWEAEFTHTWINKHVGILKNEETWEAGLFQKQPGKYRKERGACLHLALLTWAEQDHSHVWLSADGCLQSVTEGKLRNPGKPVLISLLLPWMPWFNKFLRSSLCTAETDARHK